MEFSNEDGKKECFDPISEPRRSGINTTYIWHFADEKGVGHTLRLSFDEIHSLVRATKEVCNVD